MSAKLNLKPLPKNVSRFAIYFVAFLFLKLAWWIKKNFGYPTIDQVIYHLQFGVQGLVETDPAAIKGFVVHCIVMPLVFAAGLLLFQKVVLSGVASNFIAMHRSGYATSILKKAGAWILLATQKVFNRYAPVVFIVVAALVLATRLSVWTHLKNLEESEYIAQTYVEPDALVAPANKRNLVLIYVESLENGLSDPGLMGRDLLLPLNRATQNAYQFDDYQDTFGTGWTMGGVVSTQCGLPLKSISMLDRNVIGEKVNAFMPHATCLGDVLQTSGYHNVLMQGAGLFFSGTGKFFSQHGYSEIYGKDEWIKRGEKNFNEWGLHDDQLLKNAKTKLDELAHSAKPFNLTLATIDTHGPHGYLNPTCQKRGVTDYKGIVTCTADLIADFLSYMSSKGYLRNTTVVIIGDHLAMPIPLSKDLERSSHRTIFNRFIAPEKLEKNREAMYPYSIFPSILYALGFRFDKNRLALGASGFGSLDPEYDVHRYTPTEFNDVMAKTSRRYLEFWSR